MTWVAVAVGGAAVVGAAASTATASNASSNAAAAQQNAAGQANQISGQQYADTVARNQPYVGAGGGALNELAKRLGISGAPNYAGPGVDAINQQIQALAAQPAMQQEGAEGDALRNQIRALQAQIPDAQAAAAYTAGTGTPEFGSLLKPFTPGDLTNEPGYQFGLNQGQNALTNSAAARGGLYSGAAGKARDRYNQDYASTKYNDAYSRYNTDQSNQYNRLMGITGLGQSSANQTNALGAANATQTGSNLAAGANAAGAGQIGAANALTSGLSTGLNYYQNQALLNQLQNQSGYGSDPMGAFIQRQGYSNG